MRFSHDGRGRRCAIAKQANPVSFSLTFLQATVIQFLWSSALLLVNILHGMYWREGGYVVSTYEIIVLDLFVLLRCMTIGAKYGYLAVAELRELDLVRLPRIRVAEKFVLFGWVTPTSHLLFSELERAMTRMAPNLCAHKLLYADKTSRDAMLWSMKACLPSYLQYELGVDLEKELAEEARARAAAAQAAVAAAAAAASPADGPQAMREITVIRNGVSTVVQVPVNADIVVGQQTLHVGENGITAGAAPASPALSAVSAGERADAAVMAAIGGTSSALSSSTAATAANSVMATLGLGFLPSSAQKLQAAAEKPFTGLSTTLTAGAAANAAGTPTSRSADPAGVAADPAAAAAAAQLEAEAAAAEGLCEDMSLEAQAVRKLIEWLDSGAAGYCEYDLETALGAAMKATMQPAVDAARNLSRVDTGSSQSIATALSTINHRDSGLPSLGGGADAGFSATGRLTDPALSGRTLQPKKSATFSGISPFATVVAAAAAGSFERPAGGARERDAAPVPVAKPKKSAPPAPPRMLSMSERTQAAMLLQESETTHRLPHIPAKLFAWFNLYQTHITSNPSSSVFFFCGVLAGWVFGFLPAIARAVAGVTNPFGSIWPCYTTAALIVLLSATNFSLTIRYVLVAPVDFARRLNIMDMLNHAIGASTGSCSLAVVRWLWFAGCCPLAVGRGHSFCWRICVRCLVQTHMLGGWEGAAPCKRLLVALGGCMCVSRMHDDVPSWFRLPQSRPAVTHRCYSRVSQPHRLPRCLPACCRPHVAHRNRVRDPRGQAPRCASGCQQERRGGRQAGWWGRLGGPRKPLWQRLLLCNQCPPPRRRRGHCQRGGQRVGP